MTPDRSGAQREAEGAAGGLRPTPHPPAVRRPPSAVIRLLAVLLLAAVVEGGAWVVEELLARRGIIYHPPATDGYEAYLATRDPVLGWPARATDARRDASGSRIVPASSDPNEEACVSLYGDSYTWATEVDAEHAWGNLLARRLGCRVANFGVPGYGSDQAYLRFRQNDGDRAPVVVLGHLSENIVRNVTRYYALLYPGLPFGLKPRFVLDSGGEIEMLPLADLTPEEFRRMVRRPDLYLASEDLLPGGPTGGTWGGFPHTLSVLATLGNHRIRARLAGSSYWADFYRADHPTRALQITAAIAAAFAREARRRGRTPLVVVFPMYVDVEARQRAEPWPYQPLLDSLRRDGVTALDAGDVLAAHLAGRPPAEIYTSTNLHLNEAGNRVVAEAVGAWLRRVEGSGAGG